MAQDNTNSKRDNVIDENLKRVYQDMLEQDVPDRFLDLLAQLKQQEKPAGKSSDESEK